MRQNTSPHYAHFATYPNVDVFFILQDLHKPCVFLLETGSQLRIRALWTPIRLRYVRTEWFCRRKWTRVGISTETSSLWNETSIIIMHHVETFSDVFKTRISFRIHRSWILWTFQVISPAIQYLFYKEYSDQVARMLRCIWSILRHDFE